MTDLQVKYGNAWTKIALEMPGRGENEVKNRWNSAERKKRLLIPTNTNDKQERKVRQRVTVSESQEDCEDMYIQLCNTYLNCFTATVFNEKNSSFRADYEDISPLTAVELSSSSSSPVKNTGPNNCIERSEVFETGNKIYKSFTSLSDFSDISSLIGKEFRI